MSNKKSGRFVEFMTGKGFYVILFLCIAAIGVSGYMLFFTSGTSGDTLDYLDQPVNANAEADRAVIPEWPSPSTPEPKNKDAVSVTPEPRQPEGAQAEDVPVAAITAIPKPSPSPSAATPSSAPDSKATSSPPPDKRQPNLYVWPVRGETVNAFSSDELVYNRTMGDWRVHLGMDIAAELGAQVCAVADGTVSDIYEDAFWGSTVVLDHGGGITSQYSNLMKKPVVTMGDTVKAGQVIGGVGMTAEAERREVSHLHFSMNKDNKPVDPMDYLPEQ